MESNIPGLFLGSTVMGGAACTIDIAACDLAEVIDAALTVKLLFHRRPREFALRLCFVLVNKTGYQIDDVYVWPASNDEWGSDIMGKDALADGEKVSIVFPHGGKACKFDIKVKYNDGDTAEWTDVDLCEWETISLFWDSKTTRAEGE